MSSTFALRHIAAAIFAAGLHLVSAVSGAKAETRALVIGVDTYDYLLRQQWLRGAVNDAKDIAAALGSRNVRDLTLLTEKQATRVEVISALDALIERTQKDDLVILTFSGHGVTEVWGKNHPPGVSEGTAHETFLLANVVLPSGKGIVDRSMGGDAADRLVGTELNAKFAKLNAKGARVVFVADACHGGGGTRRPPPPEAVTRSVVARPYAEGQDPLAPLYASWPAPVDPDTAIPNLTLLAAVDREHAVLEVRIPKGSTTMRGALSYAFARLIDGTAKLPNTRVVNRRFLFDYISATVRAHAENNQDPDLQPRRNPDQVIIRDADFEAPETSTSSQTIRTVRIRTEDGPAVAPAHDVRGEFDIVPVPQGQADPIDLSYVASTKAVYSAIHDLVAEEVEVASLTGIAEREYAIRKLLKAALNRPLQLTLDQDDKLFHEGDAIALQASVPDGIRNPYYALIDITGFGAVQFMYPFREKNDERTLAGLVRLGGMKAAAPFGTDMFVLITSARPLDGLIDELRRLDDGSPRALDAVRAIEKALDDTSRIGLQGFYTARVDRRGTSTPDRR